MSKRLLFEDYIAKVSKEALYTKYIEENLTGKDCASYFNIGTSMLSRLLKYYNISKPTELHTANIKKVKNTSKKYPRKAGMPGKEPL